MNAHLTVAELVERGAEPAVVAHLQTCPSCRARSRLVGGLDREPAPGGLAAALGRASEGLARTLSLGAQAAPEEDDLEPGQVLHRYRVEERLGAGGMGTVYRVRHHELGSLHALKVLRGRSSEERERLMREGRAQGGLRHANVVRVTDVIEVDGCPALVLELVEGPTLAERLRDGPALTHAEIDRIVGGILRGVAAAHRAGLVHRDLKPGNVLLADGDGVVVPKVTDFGLARQTRDDTTAITRPDAPLGTPAYMAPEQIRDASRASARSDVFSLGAVVYEIVTGRRAFAGRSVVEIYDQIRAATIPRLIDVAPGVPRAWSDAVARALAVDPDARFADAAAMLSAWQGEPVTPPLAPRAGRWAWVLGAVAIAAAVGLAVSLAWPEAGEAPAPLAPDRRLTARPNDLQVFSLAVSPDGREIAYADSRGLTRQRIEGPGLVTIDGGPTHDIDYFPDGQRLLLHGPRGGVDGVWTTALDGTDPVLVWAGAAHHVRLSPDGTAFAMADDAGLWLHRLDDGSHTRIHSLGASDSTAAMVWSPSGRSLATVTQSAAGEAWLETLSVDGRTSARLLTDDRLIAYSLGTLVWLPGDRLVYGLSQHDEVQWMALDGAERATDTHAAIPLRIFQGFAVTQIRASPDGRRVAYIRMEGRAVPYVIAPGATSPTRLGAEQWDEGPVGWADAQTVWLSSSRLGGAVVQRRLDGGPAEGVLDEPRKVRHIDRVGEDLIYLASELDPPRTAIVRARGAERHTVAELAGHSDQYGLRCRPRCLLGDSSTGALRFSWVDLDTGALSPAGWESPVRTRMTPWDLAPDGRLAVATPDGVLVRDGAGGPGSLWPLALQAPTELAWAPTGDRVYVAGLSYGADAYQLLEVQPTGTRALWSSMAWYLHRLAPSPDGANLAFSAYAFDDDVWLAEGLVGAGGAQLVR